MWKNSKVVTELIQRAEDARYGEWYPTIEVDTDEQSLSLNCTIVFRHEKRCIDILRGTYHINESTERELTWEELNELEDLIN